MFLGEEGAFGRENDSILAAFPRIVREQFYFR
jgi:hypothetical protein